MGRETVLFFVFNGIGLLIQLACVAIVVDGFNVQGSKIWYNLANLTGIGLGTLFRFWSYRKWVWLALPGGPEADDQPAAPLAGPPPGSGKGGAGGAGGGAAVTLRKRADSSRATTNNNAFTKIMRPPAGSCRRPRRPLPARARRDSGGAEIRSRTSAARHRTCAFRHFTPSDD